MASPAFSPFFFFSSHNIILYYYFLKEGSLYIIHNFGCISACVPSCQQEEVMVLERILLQTIKFDLQVEHPYMFLLRYVKQLKGTRFTAMSLSGLFYY